MKENDIITGLASMLVVIAIGLFATPYVFAGRIVPGVYVGDLSLGGVALEDVQGILNVYNQELQAKQVTIILRNQESIKKVGDLGGAVDILATITKIEEASSSQKWPRTRNVSPVIRIDGIALRPVINREFAGRITPPQNASLKINPNDTVSVVPSIAGEQVDVITLEQDIVRYLHQINPKPIEVEVIHTVASVEDSEVLQAQELASKLIKEGFTLTREDDQEEITIKPYTIKRIIEFTEQPDPMNPDNAVLGVAFNEKGLAEYLDGTIAPEINRPAVNAKFELSENENDIARQFNLGVRVTQFADPQNGLTLNIEDTTKEITKALSGGQTSAPLAIAVTEPEITANVNLAVLGLTSLVARGESDFKGSPKNRVKNIEVGASKFHGALIPPNTEFSFNAILGDVDAQNGFLPELVIKSNVTTPEYGGGLCQVSTTAFRAAVYAGLKITDRRNHSYAVSYYGTPGFDSTIYPPYTDLRFLNTTPGYILIQTKIEGTKLIFEFWGTDDGRQVLVDGPHPYDRQANGAVKAVLTQTVKNKEGEVIEEKKFYSNYKSPDLFPKVVSANGEPRVAGSQINEQPNTSTTTPNSPPPN